LNAVRQAQFRIHFAPDHKLDKVTGMDEVWDKLAKALPGAQQLAQQMKQGMGDDAMKQMMNQSLTGFLPSKPVKPGESWKSDQSQNLPGLGNLKLTGTVTFVGVEDREGRKQAKLLWDGKGTLDGNFGQPGMSLKADSVEQKGVIWFDLDRGWLADQTIEQTLKGTMTITDPAGKQLKLTIDQKLRMENKVAVVR